MKKHAALKKNIVLIGFVGSGKTTVGRRVAAALDLDFYDTDEILAKSEKMSVSQIAAKKGAAYLAGAQRFAVQNLCENSGCLIATGSDTVTDPKNREWLRKTGLLIWLKASAETAYQNIRASRNRRPELEALSAEEMEEALRQREPYYRQSDITVQVDGRTMEEIVAEVLEGIKKQAKS